MRLLTIQSLEVFEELQKNGIVYSEEEKSQCLYDDGKLDYTFDRAYKWIVNKLEEKIDKHPKGKGLPWWAWYKLEGKRDLTLDDVAHLCTPNVEHILLELDVPDNEVVLSDYDNWHYVLNNWWIDSSTNEEEWNNNMDWLDGLSEDEQAKIKEESWDKVFDIEPYKSDWVCKGDSVQANFWSLKKEYVKEAIKFVGVDIEDE